MPHTLTHTMQYFSKWRNEWIDFTPTQGELIKLKKHFYQVRNLVS
jgi:hypothetical protein